MQKMIKELIKKPKKKKVKSRKAEITMSKRSPTEASDEAGEKYILRLFVTGILPNSVRAVANIKTICEQHLQERYELEIIDIYQQPDMALTEDIIAVPLLIKKFPLPEERLIGDLSDTDKVLEALNLV